MEELSDLEKVQEVLDSLDADDSGQWTTEDLPRVEVVAGLSGVVDLTRDTLTAMFPDFVRYPEIVGDDSVEETEDEEVEEIMSREIMESMIAELDERCSEVSRQRADLLVQVQELNYQADALRDKMLVAYPPPSAAEVQRQYAQSQLSLSMVVSQRHKAVVEAAEKVMNESS